MIDAIAMGRSLNGYEEIAIRKLFGDAFENLSGMFAGRSLYFVHLRREGATDAEAYKASMTATVGELDDMFRSPDAEGNPDGSTTTTTAIGPTPISSSELD